MRIIAGPCQHESYPQSFEIAQECKRVCDEHGLDYYFKASYDKANRSNIKGVRGLGMGVTMTAFRKLKDDIQSLQILTDVHSVMEVQHLKRQNIVDVIQIPAFLCRQTDIVQEACKTGKIVNIKKGQFLAPWDVENLLSKTEGAKEVWITERGTSFGYNTLVVDFTGLDYMLKNYDVPIVGVRNFFLEVHTDPDNAPSDGPNALHLKDFESVIKDIVKIKNVMSD